MTRLTNAGLLVRVVDSVQEHIKEKNYIYNFPFCQLMLCCKGKGYFISEGGREESICEGDIIVVEPALVCSLRCGGEELFIKKIACDISCAPNIIGYFSGKPILILKNADSDIQKKFVKIFNESKRAAVSENAQLSLETYALFMQIGKSVVKKGDNPQSIYEGMTAPYVDYMFSKFSAADNIASPPQVEELFRMAYSMTPSEYNTYIRMEMSKSYVVFSADPADVAEYWGFESVEDYQSRFVEMYSVTPEKFKKLYRE